MMLALNPCGAALGSAWWNKSPDGCEPKHFKTATQSAAGKAKHLFYFTETPCEVWREEDPMPSVVIVLAEFTTSEWHQQQGLYLLTLDLSSLCVSDDSRWESAALFWPQLYARDLIGLVHHFVLVSWSADRSRGGTQNWHAFAHCNLWGSWKTHHLCNIREISLWIQVAEK